MPFPILSTSSNRIGFGLLAFVVVLAIACRGNLDVEQVRTPLPTATSTATPRPTPTPPPFRTDCDVIAEFQEFFHVAERVWFIDNCMNGPGVWISQDEVPGIGERVMEIFSVDTAICVTGLVSHTIHHRENLEAFSYQFRNFCAFVSPITLRFPPPPFSCGDSELIQAAEVTLPYLNGLFRREVEVFCIPEAGPGEENSESRDGRLEPSAG